MDKSVTTYIGAVEHQLTAKLARRTPAVLTAIILLAVTAISADLLVPAKRSTNLLLALTVLGFSCLIALFVHIGTRLGDVQRAKDCAQCQCQEGQSTFRAFMDHSPTVAYLKDRSGRLIYVNDSYCDVFRVHAEHVLGKLQSDFMSPVIARQLRAHDQQVIESKCAHEFSETIPGEGGAMREWMSFKFPVLGRTGEVLLGGVSVEVTEMVQAQDALRDSEARYRQLVEYAGDIIVRCDSGGRVTYINDVGARILKVPSDRLRGCRALRLVRPDARRRTRSLMLHGLAERAADVHMEVPVVTGDGTVAWLEQTIRILRNGDSLQGFQAICRDITDRRRMEDNLRASEERFRLLYENGPVAYHEIDGDGLIRRVNRAECEMLGYSEAELIGRSVFELIAQDQREAARAAIAAKVRQELPLQPFNRIYLRQDGRRVRVEIHENLLRDHQGEVIGIHSVLLDVTQRYLAEMLDRDRWKVSEMMAQQQPLDRVLSTISAMIDHQDETLVCIPIRLTEQRLEPVCTGDKVEYLCKAIGALGSEALSIWPVQEFRVNRLDIANLTGTLNFGEVAAAAKHLEMESCWSIPIISSTQEPLGLLLTFSPRTADAAPHEQKMLEAASRISALAIEHRYLTDLLAFQASHDSLTRLPNRSNFETRLQDAISHANQRGEQLALFYVDLDRFKEVNDTFGHSGGDELLRQVAARLRRCTRHTDALARIGGDEFSLLQSGVGDASEANRLAEGILREFDSPFEIAGWQINVTASIGISFYPRDGLDAPTLQRNSDTAMYRVKNTGKNSFACYAGDVRTIAGKAVSPGRVV